MVFVSHCPKHVEYIREKKQNNATHYNKQNKTIHVIDCRKGCLYASGVYEGKCEPTISREAIEQRVVKSVPDRSAHALPGGGNHCQAQVIAAGREVGPGSPDLMVFKEKLYISVFAFNFLIFK